MCVHVMEGTSRRDEWVLRIKGGQAIKADPAQPKDDFTLRDMEREVIKTTLKKHNFNKSLTAKKLGIARQTLLNKIKEYNLEP